MIGFGHSVNQGARGTVFGTRPAAEGAVFNTVSDAAGNVVQARDVHGGIHFHTPPHARSQRYGSCLRTPPSSPAATANSTGCLPRSSTVGRRCRRAWRQRETRDVSAVATAFPGQRSQPGLRAADKTIRPHTPRPRLVGVASGRDCYAANRHGDMPVGRTIWGIVDAMAAGIQDAAERHMFVAPGIRQLVVRPWFRCYRRDTTRGGSTRSWRAKSVLPDRRHGQQCPTLQGLVDRHRPPGQP